MAPNGGLSRCPRAASPVFSWQPLFASHHHHCEDSMSQRLHMDQHVQQSLTRFAALFDLTYFKFCSFLAHFTHTSIRGQNPNLHQHNLLLTSALSSLTESRSRTEPKNFITTISYKHRLKHLLDNLGLNYLLPRRAISILL